MAQTLADVKAQILQNVTDHAPNCSWTDAVGNIDPTLRRLILAAVHALENEGKIKRTNTYLPESGEVQFTVELVGA